jgi:hypothetical protein
VFEKTEGVFVSNQKNEVFISPAVEPPATSYHEAAQALVDELRRIRETIPHFTLPARKNARQVLNSVASLPPEFIEQTAVARANNPSLVRGDATSPAESRDLLAYADAYAPVADELEALAQFVRFSGAAAKAKAGTEALTTYALAQRLVRRPEHAALAPYVTDMRRAFGKRAKGGPRKKQPDAEVATTTPPSTDEKK